MSEHNPYSSPVVTEKSFGNPRSDDGFVKQVPIIGILMIVCAVLEILMGLVYIGLGFFVPYIMEIAEADAQARGQQAQIDDAKIAMQFMFWIYAGMGACGVLGGLVRLVGGIQVVRFKSHLFGIIGNFAGLLAVTTCYCSPFSIGISIYGLIVLFQGSVKAEFARRAG